MHTKRDLKNMYGKLYVESYELSQSQLRLKRLVDHFYLNAADDVVDFACGNGLLMPLVSPIVHTYTGVDFSESFIDVAQRRMQELSINNARFACSEIVDFCIQNENTFDVGFAMDFSAHVYDREWLEILRAMRVSLKRNGKLYFHTPNAEFFLEKMKSKNLVVKQFPEMVAVRSPHENQRLIEQSGLLVKKVILLPHYNILRLVHPMSYLPGIGKYFKARIFIEAVVNK